MPYSPPIKTFDPSVKAIALAAFPQYRGRKFSLSTSIPSSLDSYWDGGSKDSFAFVMLSTKAAAPVHSNHPFFEKNQPRDLPFLPLGMAIVRHSIFCGKDCGLEVIVNPADLASLLPSPLEVKS